MGEADWAAPATPIPGGTRGLGGREWLYKVPGFSGASSQLPAASEKLPAGGDSF